MTYEQLLIEYSTIFLLTAAENKIFIDVLLRDDNSPYTPFILALYKEVNNDLAKFLRVLSAAAKTPGFAPRGLIRKVLMGIREAIVIHELRQHPQASVTELTNLERYKLIGINRNSIYQTITKYHLR